MSNLVFEVLLRLSKAAAALVIGVVVFLLMVGGFGASPSPELALLSWIGGAAFILLVESSPI